MKEILNFIEKHPFWSFFALDTVVCGIGNCVKYISGYKEPIHEGPAESSQIRRVTYKTYNK